MRGISWLAEGLLRSPEELASRYCSTVSYTLSAVLQNNMPEESLRMRITAAIRTVDVFKEFRSSDSLLEKCKNRVIQY
jgi:hypothetical protein